MSVAALGLTKRYDCNSKVLDLAKLSLKIFVRVLIINAIELGASQDMKKTIDGSECLEKQGTLCITHQNP